MGNPYYKPNSAPSLRHATRIFELIKEHWPEEITDRMESEDEEPESFIKELAGYLRSYRRGKR